MSERNRTPMVDQEDDFDPQVVGLIGGPEDGRRVYFYTNADLPDRILVADRWLYDVMTDPETGDRFAFYFYAGVQTGEVITASRAAKRPWYSRIWPW